MTLVTQTTETNLGQEKEAVIDPTTPTTEPTKGTKPAETTIEPENKGSEKPESNDSKSEPKAPEKYEFSMPEGFDALDSTTLDQFTPIAKELDLTQEQAQKLVDIHAKSIKAQHDQMVAQVEEWATQTKADKEIGGSKLNENIEYAKKAIDRFGSPDLVGVLEDTGLGNHPEVVRLFMKIGKAFSEDSFVSPNNNDAGKEKDAADVLYPSK